MKKLIIKLDDIGRESHRAIFDATLWAMDQKLPISIGTIGNDLRHIPNEVASLIKLGMQLGFVEVWNHGYRHIRYDQNDMETVVADLVAGHQTICDTLGAEPAGFGFPFNRLTPELVTVIRNIYPRYFIYEADFDSYKLLSPEFNSLADGQPRFSYFMERVGAGNAIPQGIILQAHPPRWTNSGFAAFKKCVEHLVEQHKFLSVKAADEVVAGKYFDLQREKQPVQTQLKNGIEKIIEVWELSSEQLNSTLSNFKSYFLPRFVADTEKNFFQVRRAIYPFKPKKILDVGCGLGNWSLPFLLTDTCESLVLNDINATIMQALKSATSVIDRNDRITLESRDLLQITDTQSYRVDFLVSANTFNYLDPVQFFRFAQSATVPGARLLLMYQTEAFNKLRFRYASTSRDASVLAEVLTSDMAMIMRRTFGLHPTQVRHVYSTDEISKLAVMFDFSVESHFVPSGESKEDGASVYECLIFRRTSGMRAAILAREEWLTECNDFIDHSFGPQAYVAAGLPELGKSQPFAYSDEWKLSGFTSAEDEAVLLSLKRTIAAIRQGAHAEFDASSTMSVELREFAEKVKIAAALFAK